jgi:deferrochelatase/peroxidase EfeB
VTDSKLPKASDATGHRPGRRSFLTRTALVAATAPIASSALAAQAALDPRHGAPHAHEAAARLEPFYGVHQGGIANVMQRFTYFMAFSVTTTDRNELIKLLRAWTDAAATMTQQRGGSRPASPDSADQPASDSGAALGLLPARLTLTFGFGPTLFMKDGVDRFGLASQRPAALADLPRFAGDQLVPERTGGDISIQACADDPQVAEWAIRKMVALAYGMATIAWAQTGFSAPQKPGETPRNTMGFKDGTMNVSIADPVAMNQFVWAGEEGPAWMRGGSYMVVRPIRIALEHWDRMKVSFQEQTIGRHKASGAPIGKTNESDPIDLEAEDKDGNPVIAENAHARLAAPASNDGAQILRRGYMYDNGVAYFAERWPPWRQAMTFDSGLLFICYQRDPRTGFSKIFEKMAKFDMLNQFTTHVGSGLFACPSGIAPGQFVGEALFKDA